MEWEVKDWLTIHFSDTEPWWLRGLIGAMFTQASLASSRSAVGCSNPDVGKHAVHTKLKESNEVDQVKLIKWNWSSEIDPKTNVSTRSTRKVERVKWNWSGEIDRVKLIPKQTWVHAVHAKLKLPKLNSWVSWIQGRKKPQPKNGNYYWSSTRDSFAI